MNKLQKIFCGLIGAIFALTLMVGSYLLAEQGDTATFGWDTANDVSILRADSTNDLIPGKDNSYDLGMTGYEFKDLYLDGTANIDALVADTADINGGTIDGATIGASSASTGAFTTLSATGLSTLDGGVDIGTVATGVDFTGTYTGNVIDFSNSTHVPTGSNGPCLIRAGTYTTPITNTSEAQSGLMRLYMSTSADGTSYDRGVFVCLKTTGIKNIFPVAGLAEVLEQSGNGPDDVCAAQFISGLHTATSKLATGGYGMFGVWNKVYSVTGSVAASSTTVAPIWCDSQMSGTVSGDEYGIYATTGGTRPDGFIGFEASSSGYDQFIYAETSFNSGAGTCITTDAVPGTQDARIKVWYNGAQYYIPLYR